MKRILAVIIAISATGVLAEQPLALTITTTKVMLSAPRTAVRGTTVTNGQIIAQGSYQRAGTRDYWAVTGGVTTNRPSQLSGDSTDDVVTWRVVGRSARRGFYIANAGTNSFSLAIGSVPVSGKGITLAPGATFQLGAGVDDGIYGIGPATNCPALIQEW